MGYIYYFRTKDFTYVGATRHKKGRENRHRNYLRKGRHQNSAVQSLYDAGEIFSFEVVESGDWSDDELSSKEVFHEQKLRSEGVKLLNTEPCGQVVREDQRKKLSEAMLGQRLSEEAKRKLSEAHTAGRVMCVETGKVYLSARAAAKDYGWNTASGILGCLVGERRSAGGFHWQSVPDEP